MHILILDDDPVQILITRKTLEKTNKFTTIKGCINGLEAIEYLDELIEKGQSLPHLILVDLQMPIMDGWVFLDELKSRLTSFETTPHIWVISSFNTKESLIQARNHPMVNKTFAKPLDFRKLGENVFEEIFNTDHQTP